MSVKPHCTRKNRLFCIASLQAYRLGAWSNSNNRFHLKTAKQDKTVQLSNSMLLGVLYKDDKLRSVHAQQKAAKACVYT